MALQYLVRAIWFESIGRIRHGHGNGIGRFTNSDRKDIEELVSENQQVQALEVASARHHIVREVAVGDGQLPLQRAARIAGADRVDEPVAVRLHTADDLRHRERRRGGGGSSSSSGGVNRGGVGSGIIPRRRSPAPVIILALRRATGPLYAASVAVVTCDISNITY